MYPFTASEIVDASRVSNTSELEDYLQPHRCNHRPSFLSPGGVMLHIPTIHTKNTHDEKRLQAQLSKGAPSVRLLERARCLKREVKRLEDQVDTPP